MRKLITLITCVSLCIFLLPLAACRPLDEQEHIKQIDERVKKLIALPDHSETHKNYYKGLSDYTIDIIYNLDGKIEYFTVDFTEYCYPSEVEGRAGYSYSCEYIEGVIIDGEYYMTGMGGGGGWSESKNFGSTFKKFGITNEKKYIVYGYIGNTLSIEGYRCVKRDGKFVEVYNNEILNQELFVWHPDIPKSNIKEGQKLGEVPIEEGGPCSICAER